ncbi:hypothetical protein Ae406Ps2_3720c [Pseudonocardia sp. Ae406_Ps2]|nr:hypothetical protein Ae331Ps2_2219 [Pseudonocardia sp. Ae331_Ps2]OLM03720.1 hypothetical protein Ae406Ps2_3720c [Pseudonocardia sp. Ae406_Ps2]OLM11422.1 hypothetical protein Ae505Ps2_1546 [Pseudonocardia sp. Ae505_Ps2]OLM25279.1 hypothetical protein Ae706Ps2_3712c [Pseudonocardia sp. Ae706_Ps2]
MTPVTVCTTAELHPVSGRSPIRFVPWHHARRHVTMVAAPGDHRADGLPGAG